MSYEKSSKKLPLKPLGNRVLVRRWPEIEEHTSGLILPAAAREKPQIGRVLAVGSGVYNKKSRTRCQMDVAVGDDVVFEKFVSVDHKIIVDGVEFLLLPYSVLYLRIVGGVRGIDL